MGDNEFGNDIEEIAGKKWNWRTFKTTEGFPISPELMDWIIGQDRAIIECKLCVLPDTEITSDLPLRIKDNPVNVLTHNGTFEPVTKRFRREYSGRLYSIRTFGDFRTLSLTENHPILTIKRKQLSDRKEIFVINDRFILEWKLPSELEIGDYVVSAIPERIIKDEPLLSKKHCRLIGYFLAEGYQGNGRTIYFALHKKEVEYAQDIQDILKTEWQLKSSVEPNGENGIKVVVHSVDLVRWFAKFGFGAENKMIPFAFMNLPNEKLFEILKGWIRGDGHFRMDSHKLGIFTITVSYALARQTETIMRWIGLAPSITSGHPIGKQRYYCVSITGKQLQGISNLINDSWIIPSTLRPQFQKIFNNGKYIIKPIRYITSKEVNDIDVMNLEIEPSNSYEANGIIVHNCIDEWVRKLLFLKKKQWWKIFEDPMTFKPQPKEMLPAGPFLLMLGDAGTGKSLLGRAMQNYMTNLYKKNNITLTSVISWKNPTIPQEPKISIHTPQGAKEKLTAGTKKAEKKGFWSKWGMRIACGFLMGLGGLLLGLGFYNTWLYMTEGLNFSQAFTYNAMLIMAGGSMLFSGIFLVFIRKMFGNIGGGNTQGIGGATNSNGPKLLIDNSADVAPFIDATGHGSAQLFGSIAWNPYQCCPKNQIIITNHGLKYLEDCNKTDKVLGQNGTWKKITDTYVADHDAEVICIKGYGIPLLKVTKCHPIYIIDKVQIPEWKLATQLDGTEILLYPKLKVEKDIDWVTNDLAYLFGLWVADGYILDGKQIRICIGDYQIEMHPKIENLLNRMGLSFGKEKYNNATRYNIYSTNLVKLVESIFGKGKDAFSKEIPIEIILLPHEKAISFIKGYIDGDGGKEKERITTSSVSDKLSRGFQFMLAKNCLWGNYRLQKQKGKAKRYEIQITPQYASKLYPEKYSFNLIKSHPKVVQQKSWFEIPIRKVYNEYYKGKIYDVTSKDGCFSAPFLVHNTGGLGTPEHQRVTAGDVHRAHLGILYIDEIKNLTGVEAITLLTVLEDGQLPIALRSQYHGGDTAAMAVSTEPVPCFIAGTKVLTINGFKNIEDIHIGEYVLTHNGRFRKVMKTFVRDYKGKLIGIQPHGYRNLIWMTPEHPILTEKSWIPIKEYKDEQLIFPLFKERNFIQPKISEEQMRLIGYYLSEGSIQNVDRWSKRIKFSFKKDEQWIKDCKVLIKQRGRKPYISIEGNGENVYCSDTEFAKWVEKTFGKYSTEKDIPLPFLGLPKQHLIELLRGMIRGDGTIYPNKFMRYGTSSPKLAMKFLMICHIIGIHPSFINYFQKESEIKGRKIQGGGEFWLFSIQGNDLSIFDKTEGKHWNLISEKDGQLMVPLFKKDEKDFDGKVYNLEVEEDQSYLLPYLTVHNCMCFLVAAGNMDSVPQINPALLDRIRGYGKIVYMNNDMDNNIKNRRKYIQFISQEVKRFNLLPFTKEACLAIISESRKKSGRNDKLTSKFRPMISVIKTASTLAANANEIVVNEKYINEAISEHCKSIAQQVLEREVENENIYKDINPSSTPKVGQIHALAVSEVGDEIIGSVTPIKTSMIKVKGKKGDRGDFTVTGISAAEGSWAQNSIRKVRHVFLQLYKKDPAIDYITHIDFAQEIGVDGPSAGAAMTLTLISAYTKKKIRQDVAVTGEINIGIDGEVVITPIGGAHEKIMAAQKRGFKKVCIPKVNYDHNIIPSEYTIKIVPCKTIQDYMREVFA